MNFLKFENFGSKIDACVINEDVTKGLPFEVLTVNQVHGNDIYIVGQEEQGLIGYDGIICNMPGIKIMIKTADCIPVVIADVDALIIAAIHAGWKSLTRDIISLTLKKMLEMGAKAENLKAGIGPSIGFECSEFSDPYNEMPEKFHYAIDGKNVDLNRIAMTELCSVMTKEKISHINVCTKCDPNWFSFRRNGSKERFGTMISIK